MNYKCVIVDDEELARELLENHLRQFPEFELVATCKNAIEARSVLQQQPVDLLFLDIEMPVIKGTAFYKSLLQQPDVIFTTAHRNYAVDGFDLNAVDYLLKPITIARFFKALDKFLARRKKLDQSVPASEIEMPGHLKNIHIFIRKDRKQVKLHLDRITYIESLKDYISIYTTDEKHTIKHSISTFLDLLDHRFIRIHRSFIINTDKITAYTKQDVEIGSREIPIGESYKEAVSAFFSR